MLIEYIIIAILQGLLEWLPISSSGQVMIVAMTLLNLPPDEAFSLSIWLHLGTTIAVIVKFRTNCLNMIKTILPKRIDYQKEDVSRRNWLIFGTIGSVITAIPFYFFFKFVIGQGFGAFEGDLVTLIISGLLVITGILLIRSSRIFGTRDFSILSKEEIRRDSFLAGLMQGLAILPGISRSGVTTSTILFENHQKDTALRLSFLMSIPVTFGAILFDIIFGEGSVFGILNPIIILIITAISFIVGYLSIEILLRIVKKVQFGYFCILYGIISFIVIIPFYIISPL